MHIIFSALYYFLLYFTNTAFCCEKLRPENPSPGITKHIFFLHHQGPTVNDYTRIPYEDALCIPENIFFNKDLQTVFYLHGWTEQPSKNEESIDTIVTAFLKKKTVNLIVLDYAELVQGHTIFQYISSVLNVTSIGQALAHFLHKFIPNTQTSDKIHLIGHSLGSQVISRTANSYGRGKLKWLTDPAGPLFSVPIVDHLSKEDAEFVDVIHTDAYGYGDGRTIGHVDFFPNLGSRHQPYCKTHSYDFCSHHMSWKYYAESVINEDAFLGKFCEFNLFCTRYTMAWCCNKDAPVSRMGYGTNKTAHGTYYFRTNEASPFGLGANGFYV